MELEGKQVAVVGQGKSHMAGLLAASMMVNTFGGSYGETLFDTIASMKSMGYFPKHQRDRPDLMPKKEQGRNEPCSCGSGKKYKKCCGK